MDFFYCGMDHWDVDYIYPVIVYIFRQLGSKLTFTIAYEFRCLMSESVRGADVIKLRKVMQLAIADTRLVRKNLESESGAQF
jgi:hypothetical protein